ncbi:MAG TPA: hypothetical protein VGF59_27590 [Bryobacteraceae bacterium]|jgi:hypothetical protein
MNPLAEVSDKIVSAGQMWAVMGVVSVLVGALALASRSWGLLLLAVPISTLGCMFTLSFLDDPLFGDAVLQENGWSWFASNVTASLLPIAAVVVTVVWSRRSRREFQGFEVVPRDRGTAE